MVKVYSYSNNDEIAQSLAKFIVSQQDSVLATKEKFNIAISGGSLIGILGKGLLNNKDIKWDKWVIYFSDERIVPLRKVGPTVVTINENLIHPDDHTTDGEIAQTYASELPESGLDLVLLGCGPDGHTCSLFPGHKLLEENELDVAALHDSPKPPPRRITLTFKYLAKCTTLAFVATGASKQEALKEIFGNENSQLPCAITNRLVSKVKGGICWFVDDDAIEGVDVQTLKY
ncbi:hypothetical protein CAS74_003120 [Pichia kudriavzevii]|uniref:6-phosphogluconolactonase n=1 Tax=Pichia kudriavzevii TaxID=4909 RepID=A0A1Z8JNI5_PICKU|nr:hypothetical protein CAS74_003120 [Pichia kudriavzevii]